MATLKGIDVSTFQGDIDWTKVKGKVDFAIIRAGFGNASAYPSQIDAKYERNYKGCKDNGIPCGIYWYSYAKTTDAAKQEAKSCLAAIKGKKLEYPIYFDVEEADQFSLGKTAVSNIVSAFCKVLEDAGYFVGLYISRSPLQTHITSEVASRYALWVAEYADKLNYSGDYGIWQYSSKGTVSGISGNVDTNYGYIDYPSIIKSGGFNGYEKTDQTKKTLDTSGYKKGDKSDGVLAYKCLLLLAKEKKITTQGVDKNGSFGDGTHKATNQLLAKWGYAETGIAGEKLIKKLYEMM